MQCDENMALTHYNQEMMDHTENNIDTEPTYCDLKKMNPIDSEDQAEMTETIYKPKYPPLSYCDISFYNPITDQ